MQTHLELVDESAALRIIGGNETPINRATLWRGVKAGRYPKPIKVTAATNRWVLSELVACIEARMAAREAA